MYSAALVPLVGACFESMYRPHRRHLSHRRHHRRGRRRLQVTNYQTISYQIPLPPGIKMVLLLLLLLLLQLQLLLLL